MTEESDSPGEVDLVEPGSTPPRRRRLAGRMISATVERTPALWPLLRPFTRRFFERAAEGWDERTGAGTPSHLAPLAVAATHVSEPPERAIDIGTGTGEGALLLAREFPHALIFGVDLSESMIRLARRKVRYDPNERVRFSVADAAALDYADQSFELVSQINMPPFFDEVVRILKPGGHILIASSLGESTPFHTPHETLRRELERRDVEQVASGEAASGTYFVGRRRS